MLQQGFLKYLPSLQQIAEEEYQEYKQRQPSIFTPVPVNTLDPKDPQLLNKMFNPMVCEADSSFFRRSISPLETSRTELQELEQQFDAQLILKQARKSGICPIRQELHNQLFDQIIRQVTVNLPERGILLMRVRDNLKMTFAAYQTLYEGSLVFGSRKAHVAEMGRPELEQRITMFKNKKLQLENRKIILENELAAVVQGFKEITVIEEKAHTDEIVYLQNQSKRLEDYLNGLYGD